VIKVILGTEYLYIICYAKLKRDIYIPVLTEFGCPRLRGGLETYIKKE
jgi:hypothetical protein